ncbi:ABC transporter ATP-binding protein [Beggiatoa sp. PS]|nr:ABC transporter ATP-binding protein [Beggiatoa sp. PS]
MAEIEEILDSDYWKSANIIHDLDVTAYVEGLDDECFWRDVFRKYAPSLRILFSPYSRDGKLKNGKKFVLNDENLQNAGKNLILCVDSDYDYLVGNQKLSNPYVFHTYTYSIENYKLSPQGLTSIIQKAAIPRDDQKIFSFEIFLSEYSKCIYPLFLYILFFEKQKLADIESGLAPNEIKTETLLKNSYLHEMLCVKSSQVDALNNGKSCLEFIQNNVTSIVAKLSEKYPEIELSEVEEELKLKQISETEIFWYMRGHLLYNSVIIIIMQKLIKDYRQEKRNEYKTHSDTTQRENKLKEYNNKVKYIDWKTLLYTNYFDCLTFDCCPTLKYIECDITAYLKSQVGLSVV